MRCVNDCGHCNHAVNNYGSQGIGEQSRLVSETKTDRCEQQNQRTSSSAGGFPSRVIWEMVRAYDNPGIVDVTSHARKVNTVPQTVEIDWLSNLTEFSGSVFGNFHLDPPCGATHSTRRRCREYASVHVFHSCFSYWAWTFLQINIIFLVTPSLSFVQRTAE